MSASEIPEVVSIVFMGDSITHGQYIDPSVRWTSLLINELVQQYKETGLHVYAVNNSISGETTRQGLERYPQDVQSLAPDILTIEFGLNDCNCWVTDNGLPRVSEAAFRANLIEMIVRARQFGTKYILLFTNQCTTRQTKILLNGLTYEENNARYSEIIREVAQETGVVLCDVRKGFEPYSFDELADLLLPYPDQLHLSIKGHQVYADIVLPYIQEAIETVRGERNNGKN